MKRGMLFAASKSLLIRILLIEAIIFFSTCIILPLITSSDLRSSAAAIQDQLLRGQADALRQGLTYDPRHGWQMRLDGNLNPIFATGYDGRAYAVVDADHQIAMASRYAQPKLWPATIYQPTPQRFEAGALTGFSLPSHAGDHHAWVVVTQDQAGPGAVVDDVMRAFLSRYIVALVALLIAMQLLNGLLLWQSFRKLRGVANAAAAIGPRSLNTRLNENGMPTEVLALVHAINGLLARVQTAFHSQEEFAGNVAHEIKTPLATLRLQAEQITDLGVRAAMSGQIERMGHAMTQLRDLAMLERATEAQLVALDLSALIVEIVAEMTPRILGSGHRVAVTGRTDSMIVNGNRGLLGMAIGNLIDNALAHTPPDCEIEITLLPSGFQIADDGPGIAEDSTPRLLRRFYRADHVRSDGAGLGLAIVQRIVDAHHAQFEVGRAMLGGASFSIFFPSQAPGTRN